MTKREFYNQLRKREHDPPGKIVIYSCYFSCDCICFDGGTKGESFQIQFIQSGDYARRRFASVDEGGYKENSKIRGERLLEQYQRWYNEWLAEKGDKDD